MCLRVCMAVYYIRLMYVMRVHQQTNEKLEAQVQRLQDEVTKHKEAASSAHAALAAANSAANGDGGGSVDAAAVATAVAAARAQASAEHDAALKKVRRVLAPLALSRSSHA